MSEYNLEALSSDQSRAPDAIGSVPVGGVIMYVGMPSQLPRGWRLCDGSRLTGEPGSPLNGQVLPRLNDHRFPMGSSNPSEINVTGGNNRIAVAGAHTHSGTTDGAGRHTHGMSAAGVHEHGGRTSTAGRHSHRGRTDSANAAQPQQDQARWGDGPQRNHVHSLLTNESGEHAHSVDTNRAGEHVHSVEQVGNHQHAFSTSSSGRHTHGDNRPAFSGVHFIIRVL